jgi:hypothetical protein
VDVGLEDVRRPALQIEREVALAIGPEPMREPVGLQRVETLKIEEGFNEAFGGRVALDHSGDVGA